MASRKMSKKEKEEFEYNEALKKLDVIDYENKANDLKKRKYSGAFSLGVAGVFLVLFYKFIKMIITIETGG